MKRIELVGRGIQHSASPGMWNRIFAAMSSEHTYGLRDIDEDLLADAIGDLRRGMVVEYHVTMPYKQWAFDVAERHEPDAQQSGVANRLTCEAGILTAANTDVAAARILLRELPTEPRRVLVLGAGATGMSLTFACSEVAEEVCVTNRSPERSRQLKRVWPHQITVIDWDHREAYASEVDLVVNTTSCGLTTTDSPLRTWTAGTGVALYDLVYRREPTALQVQAAEVGGIIVDGLAHLQAHAEATIARLGLPSPTNGMIRDVLVDVVGRHPLRWDRLPRHGGAEGETSE